MSNVLRDDIRAAIFGARRNSTLVSIGNPAKGLQVEVRQPIVGDMLDSMDNQGSKERITRMMIDTVFVPGTDEKVFTAEDAEQIVALPANADYQSLMEALTDNMNAKKQGAAAKN